MPQRLNRGIQQHYQQHVPPTYRSSTEHNSHLICEEVSIKKSLEESYITRPSPARLGNQVLGNDPDTRVFGPPMEATKLDAVANLFSPAKSTGSLALKTLSVDDDLKSVRGHIPFWDLHYGETTLYRSTTCSRLPGRHHGRICQTPEVLNCALKNTTQHRMSRLPRDIRIRIQLYTMGVVPNSQGTSYHPGQSLQTPLKENAAPDEFLKMTSAQKKAFYSSPQLNRIPLMARVRNLDGNAETPKPYDPVQLMDLDAFENFCKAAQIYPALCQSSISLKLWHIRAFATSVNDVQIPPEVTTQTRSVDKIAALVNKTHTLRMLDLLAAKVAELRRLCKAWEVAMRKLPSFVRAVQIHAIIPNICDHKELSNFLSRMYSIAVVKTGRKMVWEVFTSLERQPLRIISWCIGDPGVIGMTCGVRSKNTENDVSKQQDEEETKVQTGV